MGSHPAVMFSSQVHFSVVSGDHRLSSGVRALSDVLHRELAALLRETEYIWRNLTNNEVDPLTFNQF